MVCRTAKKTLNLFTIFCFLVTNHPIANFAQNIGLDSIQTSQKDSSGIQIPSELGSIKDAHLPDDNRNEPFIVHIQTAHANYETARKVEQIIRYLRDRYGIDLLFVEGAGREMHPELLNFFQDPDRNRMFLDELAQKGELSGADLALAGSSMRAVGIESQKLYQAAFHDFRKLLHHSKSIDQWMDQQKRKLDSKASQIFSPSFRDFLETWQNHQANRRDFAAVAKQLRKEAEKALAVDFNDPFSQFEWPQFTRFSYLQELENRIDPASFQKEKSRLEIWLKQKKISSGFVESLASSETPISRADYEKFLSETYPSGFRFKDYPQVTHQAAFKILQGEMDASALFGEMDNLFEKLFKAKAVKTEEMELLEQYKKLGLLRKLLHLELNCEEWRKVRKLIAGKSRKFKSPAFTAAVHFYVLSERRENNFYQTLNWEMIRSGKKAAILMTGGFHAEGMSRLFRKNGIAYISVLPHLSGAADSSLYHQIMLGQAHLDKPDMLQLAGTGTLTHWEYVRSEFDTVSQAFRQSARQAPTFAAGDYFDDRTSFLSGARTKTRRVEMRRKAALDKEFPIALLGAGEEFAWPFVKTLARDRVIQPSQTMRSVVHPAYDGRGASIVQKDIEELWDALLGQREKAIEQAPSDAVSVKSLPSVSVLMHLFGAGYENENWDQILLFRPGRELSTARDIVEEAKEFARDQATIRPDEKLSGELLEIDKTIYDFHKTASASQLEGLREKIVRRAAEIEDDESILQKDFKILFLWLDYYARLIDEKLVHQTPNVRVGGSASHPGEALRPLNVQNILGFGAVLEASGPGWISYEKYRGALNHLAAILKAPGVPIHASLQSIGEATLLAELDNDYSVRMADGTIVRTSVVEGEMNLKRARIVRASPDEPSHLPIKRMRMVDPRTKQPVNLPATPDAIKTIEDAHQLLIAPNNLDELAALLSAPEIVQALVQRKKTSAEKQTRTLLIIPPTTRTGSPAVIDMGIEARLREITGGTGLADIVDIVVVNDLRYEPKASNRKRFEAAMVQEGIQTTQLDPEFESYLREPGHGVQIFRASFAELVEIPVQKPDSVEWQTTYQFAPNMLADFLAELSILQRGRAPIHYSDIDGTEKESGPTHLSPLMSEELALAFMARMPLGQLTGGDPKVVDEVTINEVRKILISPERIREVMIAHEERTGRKLIEKWEMGDDGQWKSPDPAKWELGIGALRYMPLQAVAGSLTLVYNRESQKYEFVSGVDLKEILGAEGYRKFEQIFEDVLHVKFGGKTIGEWNLERGFPGDGSGFWGTPHDSRGIGDVVAGFTFAVTGVDTAQDDINRYGKSPGRNANSPYADYIRMRLREVFGEEAKFDVKLGSEFQIDVTLKGWGKGPALEASSKLLSTPLWAMRFAGDNIATSKEGRAGNDTSGAETVNVSLNMTANVRPVIEGKSVITATESGKDDGMARHIAMWREFYIQLVPDELKTFDADLTEGTKRMAIEREKQTAAWSQTVLQAFLEQAGIPHITKLEMEDFLQAASVLVGKKGNQEQRFMAYRALKRLSKITVAEASAEELFHYVRKIERIFREYGRRIQQENYDRHLADYKTHYEAGDLLPYFNHEDAAHLQPVEQVPFLQDTDLSDAESAGAEAFRHNQVGYQILFQDEKPEPSQIDRVFDYLRHFEQSYGIQLKVNLVTSFHNHKEVVQRLKERNYYGMDPEAVEIDFAGIYQSINVVTTEPAKFGLRGTPTTGSGKNRIFNTPGTLEGVLTGVRSRVFQDWARQGIQYVFAANLENMTTQPSEPDAIQHQDAEMLGKLILSGRAMVVSVTDQPFEGADGTRLHYHSETGHYELAGKGSSADSGKSQSPAMFHVSRDVISLRALLQPFPGNAAAETPSSQETLAVQIDAFVERLRDRPYVDRKPNKGELSRQYDLDGLYYPHTLLTRVLPTAYYRVPSRKELRAVNVLNLIRALDGLQLPFWEGIDWDRVIGSGDRTSERIAVIGMGGIVAPNAGVLGREAFETIMTSILLGDQDPKMVLDQIAALQDVAWDGAGIRREVNFESPPVILQVDAKALDPKDQESIAARLAVLPAGSVVIEHIDAAAREPADRLSSMVRQFPNLHYERNTYQDRLGFELLRSQLLRAAKDYSINPENAGFLTANPQFSEAENRELSSLGVVFQFDPAKLPAQARMLKGLSGAVFGELAEYAKLDRQVRDRALEDARERGLFGALGGAFSVNLNLWIDARRAFSSAA